MTPTSCCFGQTAATRLTDTALAALEKGKEDGELACAAISFWEIAMLFRKNRLALPAQNSPLSYMEDSIDSLGLVNPTPYPKYCGAGGKWDCDSWRSGGSIDRRYRNYPSSRFDYCR